MKAGRGRDKPGHAWLRQQSRAGESQVEGWSWRQILHAGGQHLRPPGCYVLRELALYPLNPALCRNRPVNTPRLVQQRGFLASSLIPARTRANRIAAPVRVFFGEDSGCSGPLESLPALHSPGHSNRYPHVNLHQARDLFRRATPYSRCDGLPAVGHGDSLKRAPGMPPRPACHPLRQDGLADALDVSPG